MREKRENREPVPVARFPNELLISNLLMTVNANAVPFDHTLNAVICNADVGRA